LSPQPSRNNAGGDATKLASTKLASGNRHRRGAERWASTPHQLVRKLFTSFASPKLVYRAHRAARLRGEYNNLLATAMRWFEVE
jgi:hypothetical protein